MTDISQKQGGWTPRFLGYSEGWSIFGHDEHGEYVVAENIGSYADDERAESEAEREARLIAAAPDLYEAVDEVRKHLDGEHRDKDWLETERLVRAALSRANPSTDQGGE